VSHANETEEELEKPTNAFGQDHKAMQELEQVPGVAILESEQPDQLDEFDKFVQAAESQKSDKVG
jgi:hypothetical protein